MKIELTKKFLKLYRQLPAEVQAQTRKSLKLLHSSSDHPSLHNKRMAGYEDIYELRININYRITYQKIGDTAFLRKIGTHNILNIP